MGSSAGAFVGLDEWRAAEVYGERLAPTDEVTLGFRGGDGWALVACRRDDGMLFTLGAGTARGRARTQRRRLDAAARIAVI